MTGNRLLATCVAVCTEDFSFHRKMETCLLELCRDLDIPIPIWMPQNTHDLARYRQTVFYPEQFMESVSFGRFHLRFLEF